MATDDALTRNQDRYGILDPALQGDERTTLLGFLQRQRELVIWKAQGMPEAPARAVSTPTGMTAPGVIQHLTDVERYWFREVFVGEAGLTFHYDGANPDGDWTVAAGLTVTDVLTRYAEETSRCDRVVDAAGSLDDVAASPRIRCSLRWILLHMVEETARHLGHLDLLREHIDGVVGEEPSETEPAALVTRGGAGAS